MTAKKWQKVDKSYQKILDLPQAKKVPKMQRNSLLKNTHSVACLNKRKITGIY